MKGHLVYFYPCKCFIRISEKENSKKKAWKLRVYMLTCASVHENSHLLYLAFTVYMNACA